MPEILFPTSLSGEQSTSDELARMHASMLPDGVCSMVDLTAGLGVDAMTLARVTGAHVVAVEREREVADALVHNAAAMGVWIDVKCADCRDYLTALPDRVFDAAFIDPARRDARGLRVYGLADCEPDVLQMLPLLRRKARTLIVKMSPMLDVSQILRDLPVVNDLWALGSSTECKELVARCLLAEESGAMMGAEPRLHAVTSKGEFMFTPADEVAASCGYGLPASEGWIYEPWPVVMKLAPWRLLAERFGMTQLHPNTHLYYSQERVDGFPGDGRRIIEVLPFSSSVIKRMPKRYPVMQVATRNFPLTTDVLARKLHAREGHNAVRVIGATVSPDVPSLIVLGDAAI
ncbi:class I SAM-dependent methyltransferase [uncultured Muribaculum sp.]|uniref:class I SAM-dependent methyltransferase n=1 Tax=uncultured Muribaculum sp. TaxID=1918613 RepID=UPI0025CEBB9E|nr:class I SAM-dependent methyltransferase [uncultured Muribaculum sp.]